MNTIGLRHCSILQCGRGASNQAVAPALAITRPLHATDTHSAFLKIFRVAHEQKDKKLPWKYHHFKRSPTFRHFQHIRG